MTAALVLLLLCLPHLLARSALDSTAEALSNVTETTTSPGAKSGTRTDPLPPSPTSHPVTSADGKLEPHGTPTAGSGVFSTLDNHSQGNNDQPGGDVYSSQATTGQLSPEKTGINETHWSFSNTDTDGGEITRANDVSDDNKTPGETLPHGTNTPPLHRNATRTIINATFAPIQRQNPTSSNNDVALDNKRGSNSTSPMCKDRNGGSWSPLSSRLTCFVTLWVLGVTAAAFLGLTICLWVRLSVQRERDRRGSARHREVYKGLDSEKLWAAQEASVEERVEFWYANSTTLDHGTTQGHGHTGAREKQKEKRSERGRQKRGEGEEDNLWTQPKVTIKDITDFWYSNRRVIPEESGDQT